MGSRGGGRGRGRFGGGGFRYAKQESFELFPDIQLTAIDHDKIAKGYELVRLRNTLQQELRDLPYFLEETFGNEEESVDIERYSKKKSGTKRVSLENSGYMMLQPGYFPLELVRGTKRKLGRKVEWNPQRDQEKLNAWIKIENDFKDGESKQKKEGEEDEDEDEDEEDVEKELEEELVDSETDDYYAPPDFDDDDDGGYNLPEDEDEATL